MSDTPTQPFYNAEQGRMTSLPDKEVIPRRLVYAMFGLALASLVLVSLSVAMERPHSGVPAVEPSLAVHNVTLAGEGKGALVTDGSGRVLLETENGAFVTVVRQGLEFARRKHGIAGNPPVTITEWESGRWTLDDPATGWSMELSSFGQGNLGHFRTLFQ